MRSFGRPSAVGAVALVAILISSSICEVNSSSTDNELQENSNSGFNRKTKGDGCEPVRRLLFDCLHKCNDVQQIGKSSIPTKVVDSCKETSEPLKFHSVIKGSKAATKWFTAWRTSPYEDSSSSGVVTQRPLCDDEMFLFRIDQTINKAKGYGIPFGLTKLPPNRQLSDSLILHRDGTWSLYSHSSQENGFANTVVDNSIIFNRYPIDLRNLPVGTTLGVKRSSDGTVRFYLNGIDKGIAFRHVPKGLHGFVDVANYVTQVSIVHQSGV